HLLVELRTAGAKHIGDSAGSVDSDRIPASQLLRALYFDGVGVRDDQRANRTVLQELDRNPIREARDGDARDSSQRLFIFNRVAQLTTGFRKKPKALFAPFLFR